MRIVGGAKKGARLATPKDSGIRPTGDRVRESLFNILTHGIEEFDLAGARVLDLFAGTGALGLEALSRGAATCLFVEQSADARGLIRTNCDALGVMGLTKIFRRDALQLGPAGNIPPFDLVFADPPYGQELGEKALAAANEDGWLNPGAVAILEERAKAVLDPPGGFRELDRRVYGTTQILVLRAI